MKTQSQFANEFVSRRAKAACLLNAVHELGQRPPHMTVATAQVWDALVFIGCVAGSDEDGWRVTSGGEALRVAFNAGE